MPCTPNQLKASTLSQTSPKFSESEVFLDRESGKKFVIHSLPFNSMFLGSPLSISTEINGSSLAIQNSSFDINISKSSLSITTDFHRLSQNNLLSILKCLFYLQSLKEDALEEAVDGLKSIADFYCDRNSQISLSPALLGTIQGKLQHSQVRDPIILES